MCKIVQLKLADNIIRVADLKKDCVRNIYEAASKCGLIDRVVLFGSSTDERCTAQSDVDIAVYGPLSKSKCLTSKEYKEFTRSLYRFEDYGHNYDILYFRSGDKKDSFIQSEISNGEVIYARQ